MSNNPQIIVIGAGPIGLELAVGLKTAGLDYRHFEAGCLGATINWWAPDTVFFSSSDLISISGVPLINLQQTKSSREEYLGYLRAVATQFDLRVETYSRVVDIQKNNSLWKLSVAKSPHGVGGPEEAKETFNALEITEEVEASKVIFAIGDMHLPRLLTVPGEDLEHVSHYFSDPHNYYGQNVLVVGGRNSAVEAAIRLVRIGAKVTLCYRQQQLDRRQVKFWLYPEISSMIGRGLLQFLPCHRVKEISQDSVALEETTSSGQTIPNGKNLICHPNKVLLLTGYRQDPRLFERAGIELTGLGLAPSYNSQTMETNQVGLYVAGTAAAGTQLGRVVEFIETSHVHVDRILAHIQGRNPPEQKELPSVELREM